MAAPTPPLSKRVPRELADAQSDAMRKNNIFYWFDDSNLRSGKAMIIGPPDTPYAYCPLVFSFDLPTDYPFSPPAVQILSSDGATRFHPNLYVQGKVCLSILGTWAGPKWSAVMTISTVLSSIQSLMEANPITNEPGWEKYTLEDTKARFYAEFVQARLASYCLGDFLRWKRGQIPTLWAEFADVLQEHGQGWLNGLTAIIQKKAESPEQNYTGLAYGMSGKTEWKKLAAAAAAS